MLRIMYHKKSKLLVRKAVISWQGFVLGRVSVKHHRDAILTEM